MLPGAVSFSERLWREMVQEQERMDNRGRVIAEVAGKQRLAEDIFCLKLTLPKAAAIRPGQFFNLYLEDGAHLLPRPISVCEAKDRELVLVYRRVGFGTNAFSKLGSGDHLPVLGPLGNGYPLEELDVDAGVLCVGGGLGIPPMLHLTRTLREAGRTVETVLGFRDESFLLAEFEAAGAPLYTASDTGRIGEKGTVVDVIRSRSLQPEVILACGPLPMLAALKGFAEEKGIRLYVSLEERMACGLGACLACVCETVGVDEHSRVHNRRVCKDGPVFDAAEVVL